MIFAQSLYYFSGYSKFEIKFEPNLLDKFIYSGVGSNDCTRTYFYDNTDVKIIPYIDIVHTNIYWII